MADSTPSSKDSKARLAPQGEGPRKKHMANPPDFSDSNSLVTFIIVEGEGEKKKKETKFTVHKEVACYHSEVWRAAFNSNFIEGQTQTYRLEDTTPRAFKLLVQWLYFQKIQIKYLEVDNMILSDEDYALVELWVLADRISNAKLQNHTLNMLDQIQGKQTVFKSGPLNYVYTHTSSDSLLRKYYVKLIASRISSLSFKLYSSHFPQEMLIDLATFFTEKRGNTCNPFDLSEFLVPIEEEAKHDVLESAFIDSKNHMQRSESISNAPTPKFSWGLLAQHG
ncbi:hypothetical protein LOCC1_G007718 [Lachnellula occidentalis]|uniref:BTB domain-containing protein n=1 Tax=Lachnellula occidentalis TaxID=215460 RepID=A0A8H8U681_9HELO|nr:hypothetical protein LOCC1_G007718 [Lachnellula occidentalis]